MSSTIRGHDTTREIAFGIGAFVGTLTFAFGVGSLILAMSVGVRRGQEYLAPSVRTTLLVVGVGLLVGGVVLHLYRAKMPFGDQSALATVGTVTALVGGAITLFATATESTMSAPFLTSPQEKMVLFAIAYVLIAVGLVVLRAAARVVGW